MSSRSCLSVTNDPYITKLGEEFGLEPVVSHAEVGAWMELNNTGDYPTREQFKKYMESQEAPVIPSYEGDIKPEPNTIFVFGSNPEGRHGLGAAKIARQQFGAIYGQGEGLQGNAYALPTKDLRVKENRGLKSISPEQITESIKTLYEVARENPDKQFKVAYRNTTKESLNGYTGLEMIEMFNAAGNRPPNIIFSKEWVDTGKIKNNYDTQKPNTSSPQMNSVLTAQDRVKKAFTAQEREERAVSIANLFSSQIDQLQEKYSQEGNPKSRLDIINQETPMGIFLKVKQFIEYAIENPEALDWSQEQIDAAQKTVDYFFDLANLSSRYLASSEGFVFTMYNKEAIPSQVSDYNEQTGDDSDTNIDDPLYKEEELAEGWTIKHQHMSAKSTLSKVVRRLLARIPQIGIDGQQQRDILGFPKYLNPDLAHAVLIDKLRFMTKSRDLIPMLEDLSQTRAWVRPIIDMLEDSKSLRSKFYTDFRKDFNQFWVVNRRLNDDGSYSHKTFPVNRPMGVGYLLDEWVENYSSGTVISPNSIYDSNNRVQEDNVKANIETLKVLQSGLRELRKTSGDDFQTVATWVSENIDDIASVIQSIGVTQDKDLIELALNRRPGNVKNVQIKVNHRIGSLLNQLTTMMTTINNKNIGIDKGNTKQPVDWNKQFSKTYSSLAKILSSVTEDAIESSTFENGKSYYSHQVPNYLNKLIKRFKFTKGEEFNQFINNEFAKFHQFFDFKINQLKDGWIKDLNDDPASRELLDVQTMLNFNKVDYPDLSELDYSSAMIQQFFGANSNASAWYHMPILSDSPAGLFIKFKRYADGKDTALPMREIDRDENDNPIYQRMTYKEFLLDRFVTVAQQEYERIRLVRQREELLQKNSSLKPIDNFESRGLEFQFFPQLNNSISTIDSLYDSNDVASQVALQELYKNEINEILDNEFQKAVDQWESIGLFDKTDNGNYIHLNFKTKNEADVLAQMENYFWNSAYATTQIIQMTTGDLTFYSSIEDFQKRNKQIYAPANRLDTESEYGRENQRTVILKDVYLSSNSYLNIQEALRASGLPLDQIREVMSSYVASDSTRGVNQTDAQAYSSLESFRAMEDMMGEWNEAKQALYDKLLQHSKGQGPVFTANDFTALAQMNSKKPFVYTQKAVDSGIVDEYGNKVYIKTPFQNKNSHYLITIAGLMARSPQFVALNDFMMNNNIDVVQFESSVKDGNQGAVDISNIDSKDQIVQVLEKNTGTEKNAPDPFLQSQTIHVIPYEDFGIQQPIDDHITDFTQLFGTQARKIIAGDLPLDPSFRINVNGKKYTRDQWIELYNNLIVENVLDSFIETRELFDSNESMEELLLSEIRSNSRYSRDLEAAVTLDSNGNFPIPLYEPAQSLQLQQLLSAVVKNRVTKQKIKGGQLVQVSNFGFSDDLSVRFKDKSGKLMPTLKDYLKRNPDKTDKDYRQYLADNQAGLAYYEAYMPAYSKDFIEDFMDPKTGEINVNALPADLRRVIGYRIPTEAHYSIVPIYIKGFLPSYAGSQIMLPADITAVTGSDFDIDKMYVMLPEYRRKTIDFAQAKKDFKASKRILEAIESIFQNSDIANDLSEYPETFKEFVNNNIEKYTLDRPRYEKIRYNSKAETYQNSRAARNNQLIDMMWGVLTSPEMLPNMFMPQSFDIQKKASRIITILQNTNKKDLEKWLGGKLSDVIPKLTLQELEDLSREFVESPNIINPTSQTYFHQQNMGGAKMIGIAANHNANHALMQQTDIAIGEDVAFIFDGVIKRSLSAQRNEDGELISRNVSGYLAASVDNAKDPVLKFINLNTFTADTTFLLARLGYSPLSIALFMNQPIMLDITNYYFNNRLGSESRDGLIKKFINDYKKDHSLENIDGDTQIDVSLSDLIDMMQADRNSPSFHQRQYEVALKFTEMLAAADVLSSLTSATRADTGNGGQGPSFAHTETKINKLIDYIDDNDIYGEKPLLENGDIIYPYLDLEQGDMSIEEYASHLRSQMRSSKLPMLQAFQSLGLESQEILVSKFFPHFRDDFRYVQDALRNMTFRKKLSPETMNKIYSDLFVYIMSANDYFTGGSTQAFADRFNYYTKDFVQEFKKIKSNPKYSDNELIKHLSIRRADNNNPIPSISFNNVGSLSSEQKLQIMEAWADLLYQGEDGIKLANDLFIYNYFKNGFGFGPSSFMHLAPTILKVNISQYRKSLENINNQDDNVKDRYEYFIDQFLLNRTNITELVPNIQGETSFEWTDEEGNILETISVPLPKRNDPTGYVAPQGDRQFLVRFIGKEPLMKRFVTKSINGKEYVYKYIGDSRTESEFGDIENAVYARVDRLGYNNHYVQYLYGETADNLSESLDPIEPLDPTAGREFLSEQQVPKENDYILDARSQGYGFRSAQDVLADAKSRRKEQQLQQTMVEEGYTDPNPLTNDELLDEADEKPLSKEEGDEIRRIVSNFQKKGRKMFSIQDQADAVLDSIGGYGRDGNYRRYTDPVEAENKVRDFNKNHPLRHKFVASTVKGWNRGPDNYIFYRISIKPKTIMSSIESNRTSFDRQLNQRIRNILESMGVSIGALNELERRQMINGVMDTSQANNVVDGVVELIRLAKGDRGEQVLPEEFAHFALEALGDNPIVQRLIDLVSNNNFIEEILGDQYQAYQEAYAGDELLMAKEAVGKLLAKHFLNNNPVPSTGWKALFNRVVNAIKNFWSKLTSDRLTRARAELNSEFSNVAEGILEGIYSSVMSVENIRNSSYSSQLFSLEERVNRDRALLKKMVETETKLLQATTRETSFDKDSFRQKELIEQLNKRLQRGEHIEELLGISEYISGALVSLKGIDKRIMDIYKDRDNISKPEEALSVLRDAYYVFTAYKSMLKTISDDLVKSSLEGEERFDNKLIAQIKDAKEIVEKMEGAYRELSVELFSKFLEPFLGKGIRDIYKTKTGENLDISELLEETDHDIGMLSRWLESMSRIDDLPSQLIDSVVKKKKFEARNETIDVAKKIQAAMIKLEQTGIKNTDWLFERDSDGNITGNYISDYDVAAYETAKHAKRNEIAEKYKNKNSLKDQRDRELELTDWVDSQTDLINGLRYPKRELYPSSQMAKLTAAQKEYYDTFMEIKTELDKKLPPSTVRSLRSIMIRKDLLERMTKSGSLKNAGSQLVDSIKDTFVRRPDDTDYGEFHKSNTVLDFEGNEMNSLPIYYIKDLEDMSALSLDATSSLTAYAFMVNDYAKMNEVIDALEVGRNVLRNRDIQQREGGKPKSEIVRHMGRTIQNKLFKKGEGTNLVDRLNDYYSMQIYGRYMKDQGDIKGTNIQVSKVANFINQATSATTMWLSLFVGTTNALTGAAQMNIEAAANEHFSAKDIANADIKYFRDIPQHLAQLGKRVKTSKLSLIDELFNANQDAEVRYQHSNMDRRNIFSKLFSMETMYFLSTSGEHWMHIRTVLAVMEGYKMKDSRGKEVSLYDALEVSYTDPNDPNKGAKLKLKDGYRKLDGSEFTQDDINEITNRSATINQDLHGVYNKIDRDAFQALAQGRMIEMFRKWMTRSIRRRYGKAQYVVELDQEVEGFYRTMGQFALNLLGDMKRMEFFTASKRYNELSRHQKANMRRAAMDVAQALMISSLLSFIDWDDDDDSWIKNALEYQLRRERTELLSVMPLPQGIFEEGWRILQSPMAGMTFISNVADLLQFWTWFDEVSRGRYEGKTKFQKTLMELTPLNKTIYGINHPEERLLFYKRSM